MLAVDHHEESPGNCQGFLRAEPIIAVIQTRLNERVNRILNLMPVLLSLIY